MHLAEELLSDHCPICRQQMRQVRIERIAIKRQAHAAGSNPMPVDVSIYGLRYEATFACDMVRERTLAEGRWSGWTYDENSECRNAQRVVLQMNANGDSDGPRKVES